MRKFHLIARAVILNGDSVLLARQKGMSNTFLPGGHINIGESAVTALKREIYEELGLELDVEGYRWSCGGGLGRWRRRTV